MLVTTTYRNDSRVRREARSLVEAGHDVLVLCAWSSEVPERRETVDGGVRVARVFREVRDREAQGLELLRRLRGSTREPAAEDHAPPGGGGEVSARTARLLRRVVVPAVTALKLERARRLETAARAAAADVYHAHDADTLVPASRAARAVGAKLVYDAHELASHQPGHYEFERRRDRRNERRLLPAADAVITVCDSIAEHLASDYGIARPTVVRNVPDPQPARVTTRDLRDVIGLPPDTRVILHLGRMSEARGLDHLVRSLPELPEDVHAILVGDSARGYRSHLRELTDRLAPGRCHFVDLVPAEDVVGLAASADVGVSPLEDLGLSYRYALPNKLFEYLAAGLPVVVSDLPEMRRVVTEFDAGELCLPSDVGSLTRALRRVLDDPEPYRRGACAAGAELTWPSEQKRLIDVYDGLEAA